MMPMTMEKNKTIDCNRIRQMIPDLLREERGSVLEPAGPAGEEKEIQKRHLEICPSCREELNRMRRTFTMAVQSVARLEPSPASWMRLSGEMASLQQEWSRRQMVKKRLTWAAAFLAPVLAALAWLWLTR